MKVLLDTNLLIRLEPTSPEDVEAGTPVSVDLMAAIRAGGHEALIHPDSLVEVGGDANQDRRATRSVLLGKYGRLPAPPRVGPDITDVLGVPKAGSHDEVDFALLAAVTADAVDFLVTDDQRLLRRAARIGLSGRVLSPEDAQTTFRALLPVEARPFPLVESIYAHELSDKDPIFDSLRSDYHPHFDAWLTKCKRRQRQGWRVSADSETAGVVLIKHEDGPEYGLTGPLLKVSTFKVSDHHRGSRYGELLLKALFDYAFKNRFRWVYVTVFDRHEQLIVLLEDFGFQTLDERSPLDERVMAKRLLPTSEDRGALDSLDYHIQFGPRFLKVWEPAVVPIQDQYHRKLFPELRRQSPLFQPNDVFGNAISKAYICGSKFRRLRAGATLLFYHSSHRKEVDALGVVEDVLVTPDADAMLRFVGKRTVYSLQEITKMCEKGEVLAILFRQANGLEEPIHITTLVEEGVLRGTPQSIVSVSEKGASWLQAQIEQPS
ncbi:MAG: GNAT family N-acetyltransferase [Myxococcota bacterium]